MFTPHCQKQLIFENGPFFYYKKPVKSDELPKGHTGESGKAKLIFIKNGAG